jgi:hypothetical protein
MIHLRYITLFTFCIILLFSCDFSEDNINEEAITEATVKDLFEPTIIQIAKNQSALSGYTSAALMQYFSAFDATNSAWTNYNFTNNFTQDIWGSGLYLGSLRHANELEILGDKENNSDLQAIAKILKVKEYLYATTIFGDIPLSEALIGSEQIFPAYDTQESVYQALIAMSDEAIAMIGNNGINIDLVAADIVFKGNMSSWKKFAYGLKARLHLHLSTKDAGNYNQVLTSVENSFLSIEEQPMYTWMQHNPIHNPLNVLNKQRPGTFIISGYFAFELSNKDDPRIRTITPLTNDDWEYQSDEFPLHWTSENTSLPLLSYVELRFMKAEALLQTGAPDSDIIEAIGEGIIASCEQLNLAPADYQEYLNKYASFDGLNSKKDKLERIITEAYFAYYGYAFQQAWNNYKRLKIPNLASTGSPRAINPSGDIPIRLLYSQEELDLNTVNTIEAIERQNGALLDEPLWIFK